SRRSWDAEELVGLEAQAPARMGEAEIDGERGVARALRPVHRLQEEMAERQALEILGRDSGLRKDQLQLVAGAERERRARLGADADPVEAAGRRAGAVGLDGDREALGMERLDERTVELEQRLAAGADDEARRRRLGGPGAADGAGELRRRRETAAARAVGADEIGVAEAAYRVGAVRLAAAPQVAAGEAAEHRRAAGVGPFALQRVDDLLDCVAHAAPASRKRR